MDALSELHVSTYHDSWVEFGLGFDLGFGKEDEKVRFEVN